MRISTWCKLSGLSDQKSHIMVGLLQLVRGSRFWVCMKSANFLGSLTKNTGGVIPHEIPVAIFGIELHRKPAWVALRVGAAFLAPDGGEAHEDPRLLAHL